MITGKVYWACYPSRKKGMFELRKYDSSIDEFQQDSSFTFTTEIPQELAYLLANPEERGYLYECPKVTALYKKLLKQNPLKRSHRK